MSFEAIPGAYRSFWSLYVILCSAAHYLTISTNSDQRGCVTLLQEHSRPAEMSCLMGLIPEDEELKLLE